jgi:hypothetical protein
MAITAIRTAIRPALLADIAAPFRSYLSFDTRK